MSEFTPGFVSRHTAAAHVLQRAFGDPAGFAPSAVDTIGRRGDFADPDPEPAPRHFAPADRSVNPTEGWDPFSPDVAQPAASGFQDPIAAAHAAGIVEGRAAAVNEIADAKAREVALLDQVSTALSAGAHFDRDRMAGHLRQTVLHLVTRLIGEIGIAPDVLTGRIKAAIDLIADNAESALLRLHPDDAALLEGKLPQTVFPVGDPHVARGGFVIESASTIIEDGPEIWLDQLAQAIDRVPIPPLC